MRHLDLFSGIGGFALAASWAWGEDHEVVAFCEIDKFCERVLKKHWPDVPIYADVREIHGTVTDTTIEGLERTIGTKFERRRNGLAESVEKFQSRDMPHGIERGSIDLITGGFPCQPFSCAGQRRGKEDDRHLWPEYLRIIQEIRPRWVIGENVPGIVKMELDQVLSDLESEGYSTEAIVIPACAVENAPHRRDRVWIVAHASGTGARSKCGAVGNEGRRTSEDRRERIRQGNGEVGASGVASADRHAWDTTGTGRETCDSKPIGTETESEQSAHTDRHADNPKCERLEGHSEPEYSEEGWKKQAGPLFQTGWEQDWLEVAARLCRVDDGVSNRVDRLKALGNAIVPQVAYEIMMGIKANDR